MIEVQCTSADDPLRFDVAVGTGADTSHHQVTTTRETCERLTGGRHMPERCIES